MLRRFNYTGRKKIPREDVPISLTGTQPLWGFDANLSALDKHGLPQDSRIFVEAYEHASYMRFNFGTVGNITVPPAEARILTEFEGSDGVRFRVKVVDPSSNAKLLAEADGILPLSPEEAELNKLPLLPVRYHNLGQELWRLDIPEDTQGRPTLLVNQHIIDRIAFVKSPSFTPLSWPAILREILIRIVVIEHHTEIDDNEDWRCMWLRFAQTFMTGTAIPNDREAAYGWVTETVSAFCDKYTLLAKFKEHEEEDAHA